MNYYYAIRYHPRTRTLKRCSCGTTADDLLKRTGIGIRCLSDPGRGEYPFSSTAYRKEIGTWENLHNS